MKEPLHIEQKDFFRDYEEERRRDRDTMLIEIALRRDATVRDLDILTELRSSGLVESVDDSEKLDSDGYYIDFIPTKKGSEVLVQILHLRVCERPDCEDRVSLK